MAVVLSLDVAALALSVYLSFSRGGFGLLVPAIVISSCVIVVFSGLLPPRSPRISDLWVVVFVATPIELFAVVAATVRLVRRPEFRTGCNVLLTALGGVSLLPAYSMVLLSALRAG